MHIHLPKPLHGWREFLGEVGIIVLGVLIALGAEQLVEGQHWRHERTEFLEAANDELAFNRTTYALRLRQSGCIERRLDMLLAWADAAKAGHFHPLTAKIGQPSWLSQYTSVWEMRSPDVMNMIPLNQRLAYGQLYDEFKLYNELWKSEHQIWTAIDEFEAADSLDRADQRALRSLIGQARGVDQAIAGNYPVVKELAGKLGVGLKPEWIAKAGRPFICTTPLAISG